MSGLCLVFADVRQFVIFEFLFSFYQTERTQLRVTSYGVYVTVHNK